MQEKKNREIVEQGYKPIINSNRSYDDVRDELWALAVSIYEQTFDVLFAEDAGKVDFFVYPQKGYGYYRYDGMTGRYRREAGCR